MQRILILLFVIVFAGLSSAETPSFSGVDRKSLVSEALSNVPGHAFNAITVTLDPNTSVGAHAHDAFVYAYVIEGSIRSQIDDGEIIEYTVGDSWTEPRGVIHTLTHNPSATDKATILVIFVGRAGARLTTSGDINK